MYRSAMILLQITLCLTVLEVETYSSISWRREILHRTKRQAECKPDEFKCTSGECIDIVSMCDGTEKCADGSDEVETTCKQLNIRNPPYRPLEGGCILPQIPQYGMYTAAACGLESNNSGVCEQAPGTSVPHSWALSFKCYEGYYLQGETFNENLIVVCINGKWLTKIPVCKKMCSPLVSLSVNTRCVNKDGEIDCRKPMRPGTRATGQCKPSYIKTSRYPYKEIFCTDKGQWSGELVYCEPACGRRNRKAVNNPLIAHGSAAKHGEFPWHVGIYERNDSNQWDLKCGGSLISPHIVLTAAHCVFLAPVPYQRTAAPEAFKVGLGKYYREWTHDEPYAVQANVREILVPPRYSGYRTGYELNIALLDLTRSVQLHEGVMPVCVDWQREFTIPPGALGTVAGWGKTEQGTPSDVLLLVDFPYVDYSHCIAQSPPEYQILVTSDKFCGGLNNGTGARPEVAGGGLTFLQDDLYYVYGIFSNKISEHSLTTFTNITNEEIFTWLISSKNKLDNEHGDEYPEKPSMLSPKGGGCLLPQPPEFGAYTGAICAVGNTPEVCSQLPGTAVPQNWGLLFKCSEGYYINGTQDENFYTFCVSGQWSPKIPACRKMCSPLESLSVAITCFNGESDINCSTPMRPGTRAKVKCKPLYTRIGATPYSVIFCRENGQWSYELFSCHPECGQRNVQGVNNPLITHGSSAKYGEFPWHVGLYLRNASNQWEQMCGGSLISPHIVLTAAHCVFSELIAATLDPEAIKVGLGKFYREWNHEEVFAVQADVREIVIPPRFDGQITSLAHDIALVDLTDSVQVHTGIMPVCVDWQSEFTVTPGMLGTLAGWGKTEKGISNDFLLYADLPYIDHRTCFLEVSQPFRHYITPDKFCAGYTNGTGAAEGDSGGGLTFVRDGLYYLYGVVSSRVKEKNSFLTFTDVSNVELSKWLNNAKPALDAAHRET